MHLWSPGKLLQFNRLRISFDFPEKTQLWYIPLKADRCSLNTHANTWVPSTECSAVVQTWRSLGLWMDVCMPAQLLSREHLGKSVYYSPPGSSPRGIFQTRILECIAISFSRGSSQSGDRTHMSCVPCSGSQILYHEPPGKRLDHGCARAYPPSCPTLCDPGDCKPPGSAVHGIPQAGLPECVVISFSRGSFWPMDRTQVFCTADRFFTVWATREALDYGYFCLKVLLLFFIATSYMTV